jgi:hypothetical protein
MPEQKEKPITKTRKDEMPKEEWERTSKLLAGIREEAPVLPGFSAFDRLKYASAG